jgi:hypothetical protein
MEKWEAPVTSSLSDAPPLAPDLVAALALDRRDAVAEAAGVLSYAAAMLGSAARHGSGPVVEASLRLAREAVLTAISAWKEGPHG